MKTLVFSVFILCFGLLFFAGVSGVPVNKGTENAAVNIGIPEINPLPEVADSPVIGVSGTAHAKSFILLYVNGDCVSETQATSSAGGLEGEGTFAFEDVELAEGENEIYVISSIGRGRDGFEIQSEPIVVYYEPYGKKIIGSEGGTLVSRDLALELTVPQGALQSKTLISTERVDAPLGEIVYELQPTGLVFLQPVTAIIHLTEEDGMAPKMIKVYLEIEGSEPELLPCFVDEETGEIVAEIAHFSRLTISAPLQFTYVQFKEEEKTWTENGYIKTRKRKWFQDWDFGAGSGWWLPSSNLFKGIKVVVEISSYYENFSGSIRNIPVNSWEMILLEPTSTSISQWGRNAFQECDILNIWHWTEYFQCGSRGATFDFGGVGSYYWYERWEYSSSHNLCWEIESKTKGRLELLATTNTNGASADTIVIDTLSFGQ